MSILSESGLSTTNIYDNTLYMPRKSHKRKTKNLMSKFYLGFGVNSHMCAAGHVIGRSVLKEASASVFDGVSLQRVASRLSDTDCTTLYLLGFHRVIYCMVYFTFKYMSILSESGLSTTNIYDNTLYMPRKSHKRKTKNLMSKFYLGFGVNPYMCAAGHVIGRSVVKEASASVFDGVM